MLETETLTRPTTHTSVAASVDKVRDALEQ
jgi:hypothetical protein